MAAGTHVTLLQKEQEDYGEGDQNGPDPGPVEMCFVDPPLFVGVHKIGG